MAELILKAVDFDKTSAKFKKAHGHVDALWDAGWMLQSKYDGCFGLATITHERSSCTMQSRTGEDYTASCGHILDELHEAAEEYDPGARETGVVLGEVWHPTWKFPAISGKFRKRAPCPELVFKANDLLPLGLVSDEPYAVRLSNLQCLLPEMPDSEVVTSVVDIHRYGFDNEGKTASQIARELVASGGYDGAILRDLRAPYTIGLANAGQIVKVKPTLSLDLRVKRVASGLGAKTGRVVYTILVEYGGVESFVGSGVPHILDFEVGDIVEVECMGITADGKLREPRFRGVRHDKKESD